MLQLPVRRPFAAVAHSPAGAARPRSQRAARVSARSRMRRTLSEMAPRRCVVDYALARRATLAAVLGWPHHRRGRLRRASVPAPCREVPWRGDGHQVPDLPPVPAHPRDLRVRGRTRALRRPGEAGGRTGRDGRRIWGVPGVRRRGLPELWLEPPRFVLRSRHWRAARPARSAWVPNSEQDELKYLARAGFSGREAGPRGKVANGHDAVHRQVRWTAVGWLPPPATGSSNQRGRVSNRDFPAPYRPGRAGRRSGGRPARGPPTVTGSRRGRGFAGRGFGRWRAARAASTRTGPSRGGPAG